ncbi:MAG: hypothetical protein KC475_03650 [Cyanobacteria bacterium HKST-UBA03]|nr:hypothetical protein [Cyanobacteria bacterium HKST-UBA03]
MFHGLYQKKQQYQDAEVCDTFGWPPMYRFRLPDEHVSAPQNFDFEIGLESQPSRSLTMAQIKAMPTSTEMRLIASRFGWAYRANWSCITFQTLFSLFSNPNMYEWVQMTSLNHQRMIIRRDQLSQWRLIYACNNQPLTPLYGGPLWMHNFDHYVEYGFNHIQSLKLLQTTPDIPSNASCKHSWFHAETLGYKLSDDDCRIAAGTYYAIHEEKLVELGHLGKKL